MKLTLNVRDFADAVAWATKSFDNKDEKSYVVLNVDEDGNGKLIHVNQSSYMSASLLISSSDFSKDDENSAAIALDGEYLQRLASQIIKNSGDIVLSKSLNKRNQALSATVGSSKFTIPVLRVSPEGEPTLIKLGEVNDSEFFDSLQRLSKLCSPASIDTGNPTRSVALNLSEEKIIGMATDSYSLGEITLDYTHTDELKELESSILLLPSTIASLISPSKEVSATIELVYDKNSKKFGYKFEDNRLALFSLDQASPIIYEELKAGAQASVTNSATVNLKEFSNAIATISSLAWDEVDVKILINGKKNTLLITDENGTNKVEFAAREMDFEGEENITFMRMTINQALRPISTELMKFSFSTAESTCVIQPVLDDDSIDESIFALALPSA